MKPTAQVRRSLIFLTAIAIAAVGMLALPAPTQAGTFSSEITGVRLTPTGHPGMCVTAISAQSASPLRLQPCDNGDDALQQWTITTDDRILLTDNPSRCVGNPNNSSSQDTSLALTSSCSPGANNATWPYRLAAGSGAPAGAFMNSYSGVCMTVRDGNFAEGEWIVRRTCGSGADYQQFSIGAADMRVSAATNPTGNAGATVQAQLRIENLGPQTAYHNRLAVTADAGLTIDNVQRFDAASTGYTACTVTSATAASCPAGGAWPSGATGTVTVNATLSQDAVPGNVYQVCGTNTLAPANDSDTGNDNACADITVNRLSSNLAMTDTVTGRQTTSTEVEPGAAVQLPFTLTNHGPDTAGIPKVTFDTPADFTLTGLTGTTGWTCDPAAEICAGRANTFANSATALFTLTGTVASGPDAGDTIGDITATASVTGTSKDTDTDDDTATNTLTADTDVTVNVAKTGAPTADPGGAIEYTVTIDNSGATGLAGATVTDTVPADITDTAWSCTATGDGACGTTSGTGNDITTTIDVPSGEQAVITIEGTVRTAAAGTTVTNAATVTMPTGIGGGSVTGSTDTAVSRFTDIDVTTAPTTLTPGTSGTITTTVRNNGPADAAAPTTLTLTHPDGVTVTELDPRCTDNGDRTATCTIPAETLTTGASTTITLTATLPADTPAGTVHTGTASIDYELDADTADNTADLTVNTGDPSVDLDITATEPAQVIPGENGTVTFTVHNNGPSTSATDTTATLRAPPAATWNTTGQPTECTATADRELTCTLPAGLTPGTGTELTTAYTLDTAAPESTATGTALVHNDHDATAANDTAEWQIDIAAPAADLRIDKTAATGTVTPGDQFDYTLTVHNDGPSTATEATVTDTLPAQLAFIAATGTGAVCTPTNQTVTCAYATLAPGTHTITLTAQVDPAYTGTGTDLPNSAAVTAATADPDTADNTSGTATPAVGAAAADLTLAKQTTTDTPIAPGETFTYLLEAANDGPSTATGATVTDDLPPALAFVASESGCAGTAGEYGGTVTCGLGSLGVGDETALLITVRLDPAYTGTGSDAAVTNTASLASDTPDPDAGNNEPTAGLPGGGAAPASADVSISKDKVTPGTVAPGEPVAYTLTAANDGPSDAADVAVADTLPAGMTFASSPDGCTASGQTVTCPGIASLATGSAVAYQIVANVDADYTGDGGDLNNAATAASQVTADPDTANNADTARLPAGGVTAPSADLSIAKSSAADAGQVSPGEQFTYTLTVANHGPSDATGVAVSDALPGSVSFVSSDDCTGTVGELGGTVACGPLAALPAAAGANTVDYVVTVELDPAYTGTGTDVVNAATVSAASADPNGANDSTDLTGVPSLAAGEADLSIGATVVGAPEIAPGGTFAYRVSVTNDGPSTAVNPAVTATLGESVSWDAYPSGCTVDARTLTCPAGALRALQIPRFGSATFDAQVKVDSGYTGNGEDLAFSAAVASDTADPAGGNDSASVTGGVTVTAPSADLQATKAITTVGEVAPGESVAYRVSVLNAGPSDAADVTVTDTLPDGLVFASAANDTCTADGQVVTCGPTAAIVAGETVHHVYRVTVDPAYTGDGGDLGSAATATSAATADPDTANNTAAAVSPSVGEPAADLRMTKQLSTTGAVTPGRTFRYTLTVDNLGPSVSQNTVLTDVLDDDLAFVSSEPGECTAAGATVTCARPGALPVGSHTWVLTVRLSADYTGDGSDIANTAAVASDTADPDTANNTGAVAAGSLTAAAPSADVSLAATANGSAPVAPGESFSYTLAAANAGPSTAAGVAVTGTLPAGLAFASGDDCTATGQNVTCTPAASLAVGARAEHTFTVRVDAGYTGTGADLVSTGTATAATADPDSANNTGTATVPGGSVAAPRADVSLTNAVVGTEPIVPGASFDYALTIANAGPSTATGTTVTDRLPAGLAFASSDDCTADTDFGATVTCPTVDSLAVGAEAVYTVTVRLDPAYSGTGDDLVSTATATPATADPDGTNNTGTATVPGGAVAAPEAAVSIAKTASGPVVAGSSGGFTITVTSTGPSTARDVTVTETLATGLTFASASGATCTADGGVLTCPLGALNPGGEVVFTVLVDVAAAVPDGTVLTSTAEVITGTANTADDTAASADLAVTAEAGVSLAKTPPGSMTAGAEALYAFSVRNQGPSDATGVAIAAALDAGLTFVSATGATCTAAGSDVTCEVGTVADGATASVELTVAVAPDTPAGTQLGVNAALTTATANASPDTTAVSSGPPVGRSADLSAEVAPVDAVAVVPGETFAYRLQATNNGPSTAANTVVTDQLPGALAFVSSPDDCTGQPGVYRGAVVTCRADATLPVGATAEFTITVRLHPALPGSGSRILNRAIVASDTPDPLSTNNAGAARLPTGAAAAPLADLSIVKTVNPTAPVTPGETFTYALTVANAGPSYATGVTITDTLPDPLTWIQGDRSAAFCHAEGQTVSCAPNAMVPPGFNRTYTMTVMLDPSYTGDGSDLINTASISSAVADPRPDDNTTAADAVPVDPPSGDLMLTQGFAAFPGNQIAPGQTTDNLLSLNNYGISTATDVVVSHQLPPELAFVSSIDGCTGEPEVFGGTFTCPTIDRLEPGESVFYIVTVRLKPDYVGDGLDVDSDATVDPSSEDPDEPNNTAPADMDGGVSAPWSDLSITKTAPDQMVAGREATWTIEVGNDGPSTATGVTVTDDLDPDTTFVSASPDVCSATGQQVTCDLGSLDPGDASDIALTVMVDGDVESGTRIANTASTTAETDLEGDSATADGPPVRVVTDLAIAKGLDPDAAGPVTPGTAFDYLVTVANLGQTEAAENVTFTESLPAELEFVEAADADTGERLDCDTTGDAVACLAAAVLEPGDSVTAKVTVRLDPSYRGGGDDLTNTVTVASDAVDPNGDNDTASVTGVPGGVGDPVYDRAVTVTEGRPALPGGTTTVDVAVESTGPSTADGPATVTIGMPEHIGAAELPPGCAVDGRATVVCTIGTDPAAEAAPARRAEAAAVAEASPVARWSASITLAVDEDAAPSTYMTGGTATVNEDPYDSDETTDTATWGIWTAAVDGERPGRDGGLVRTGGDSLAIVLTGAGAILTGLVISAAVTRRRGARR